MKFSRAKISDCKHCPLRDRNRVWGYGSEKPIIAIFGEAPGEDEDQQKTPFVGRAGNLLHRALAEAGIPENKVWFSNLISCRPPDNKLASPEGREAIEKCKRGFDSELSFLERSGVRVLLPAGAEPAHGFGIEGSITSNRGRVSEIEGQIIFPTYHPSFILRGTKGVEVTRDGLTFVQDLTRAYEIARKGYKPAKEEFTLNPTLKELKEFSSLCVKTKPLIAVDIETTGFNWDYAKIIVIGFSLRVGHGFSVPFLNKGGESYWKNGELKEAKDAVNKILKSCPLVFQNALFDVPFLRANGYEVKTIQHDTLILHHTIHPELLHNLGYIASLYSTRSGWKDAVLNSKSRMIDEDETILRTYNLRDCDVLHDILPGLLSDLKQAGTEDTYYKIAMPLLWPVMQMIETGVYVNLKYAKKFAKDLEKKIANLEKLLRFESSVPPEFNFDSDDHMRLLLAGIKAPQFERNERELKVAKEKKLRTDTLKHKKLIAVKEVATKTKPMTLAKVPTKKTDTGDMSLDKEVLNTIISQSYARIEEIEGFKRKQGGKQKDELQRTIRVISLLRDFREASKLYSTFAKPRTASDGRVHFRYKIHGTKTGRLSSGDAKNSGTTNAQNIPDDAKRIYSPEPGNVLIAADYKALELRILAIEAKDTILLDAFKNGVDPHDQNTEKLLGITKEDPKWKTYRNVMKRYIYQRNYGGSLMGTYRKILEEIPDAGLSFARFKKIDEGYRALHPAYASWYDETIREVQFTRKLDNAFGRVRIFLGTDDEVAREGLDYRMQSGGADLINLAMIRICKRFEAELPNAKLIMQRHDELMVEVFKPLEGDVEKAVTILTGEMQRPVTFRGKKYSFPVDFKVGDDSWATMKEAELKNGKLIL